jgi:hypothetical protein
MRICSRLKHHCGRLRPRLKRLRNEQATLWRDWLFLRCKFARRDVSSSCSNPCQRWFVMSTEAVMADISECGLIVLEPPPEFEFHPTSRFLFRGRSDMPPERIQEVWRCHPNGDSRTTVLAQQARTLIARTKSGIHGRFESSAMMVSELWKAFAVGGVAEAEH